MKYISMAVKPLLIVASIFFCAHSFSDQIDAIRSIKDPNARILAEMSSVVGARTAETAAEELTRKIAVEPNEVRHFRVLFNREQSIPEAAYTLDLFEYVHSIESKKYDPIQNLVWGSSFSDFEMYKGSAADRLEYFNQRMAFQRLAIEMTSINPELGLPPAALSIYGIEGFATYAAMKTLVDKKASSILDIRELGGRDLWDRISATISSYNKQDLPNLAN